MRILARSGFRKAFTKDELPHSERNYSSTLISTSATSSAVHQARTSLTQGLRITPKGRADIWTAAAKGDTQAVLRLYDEFQDVNANSIHPIHGTFLTAAAQSGQETLVKKVLQWGANPNIEGGQFHTPLQAAAHSGNAEVVSLLLDRGAKILPRGGVYETALIAAAERGSTLTVRLLTEKGGLDVARIIDVESPKYGTALTAASNRDQFEMIAILVAAGAVVDGDRDL